MKIKSVVYDLKPVIWKSKVGHITFVFPFFKRGVKIYQAANSTHAIFLKRTLNHPDLAGYFHPILLTLDKYIFSGSVKGVSCETLSNDEKYRVIDWIAGLQSLLHRQHLCERDEQAGFNYHDYLEKRVVQFAPPEVNLDQIRQLSFIASSPPVNESCLSHQDVTLRNIVIEKDSGNFKIIDSELLTQSPYFLLDIYNTCYSLYPSSELITYYLDRYSSCPGGLKLQPGWASSLAAAWTLRIAGSYFQAGLFQKGLDYLNDWDKRQDEIVKMIENTLSLQSEAYPAK